MDMLKLAQKLETVLRKTVGEWEPVSPPSEDGAVWGFELDDDANGFLSLDSNEGTFDVPTITVALSLGVLEDVSIDDLKELLAINGDLLGASLTLTPPLGDGQEEFLMLQTKFPAAEFSEKIFKDSLDMLVAQLSIFFDSDD